MGQSTGASERCRSAASRGTCWRISTNGSPVGQLTYDARQDDYGFAYACPGRPRAAYCAHGVQGEHRSALKSGIHRAIAATSVPACLCDHPGPKHQAAAAPSSAG
ncbi:hypothetical protein DF035_32800 [Burkholderia contaminans]|nr:hypothetical protein DF035_32800 [Burkholderia contaminans]